jgi:hypothetical protein
VNGLAALLGTLLNSEKPLYRFWLDWVKALQKGSEVLRQRRLDPHLFSTARMDKSGKVGMQ